MRKLKAFTLIELLVVLAIIGILSVIAMANYGATRQRARMDIMADTISSLLTGKKSLAKAGKGEKPMCYGVYFNTKEKPYVSEITAPYVSVDPSVNVNLSDFCDLRDGFYQQTPYTVFEDFKVTDIKKFGTGEEKLLIMFRPPEAKISLGDFGDIADLGVVNDPLIKVTLQSANDTEARVIYLDVSSGLSGTVNEVVKPNLRPKIPLKVPPLKTPSTKVIIEKQGIIYEKTVQ